MRDDRPAVYLEDRKVIYRASALGRCKRALWAARSQMERMPIPDIVQMGMDEGTNLEPTILSILHDKHNFEYAPNGAQRQIEIVCGSYNGYTHIVRGRIDQLGTSTNGSPLPIDVKAFTPDDCDKFREHRWDAFPGYAWQQSCYAVGMQTNSFFMPIFNKGTLRIEPWSLCIYKSLYKRKEIRDRILDIEEAYESNTMPDSCPSDFGCPYPYLHERQDPDQLPDNVIPIARARIMLSEKIASLTKARQALDDRFKSLAENEVSYKFEGYTITVFANPDRFNTRAAQALLSEAGIDWRTDPDYHTPGVGTQVRFTPPRNKGKTENEPER